MESWRKVWQEGLAPLLSVNSLEALRGGLVNETCFRVGFSEVWTRYCQVYSQQDHGPSGRLGPISR